MLSSKDVSLVYETLLSSPGMGDPVKISLSLPRKDFLLLSMVIEKGLLLKDDGIQNGLLGMIDTDGQVAMQNIAADLLNKAGLKQLKDKLDVLQSK